MRTILGVTAMGMAAAGIALRAGRVGDARRSGDVPRRCRARRRLPHPGRAAIRRRAVAVPDRRAWSSRPRAWWEGSPMSAAATAISTRSMPRRAAERWRFAATRAITSSPADRPRHGVRRRSGQPVLCGGCAAAGKLRWKVATGADAPLAWGFESGDLYTSSPAWSDGLVVFGSGDGQVYAVDDGSGAVRWRFGTGGRVRSSPAIANGRVYVGSMDGTLYALRLEDGRELWRFDTEGHGLRSGDFGFDRRTIQSSPAVADGRVFVGSRDGFLYAVDAASGRLLWRVDHQMSWVNTSPAVAGDLVFAGSSDERFLQAVDVWHREGTLEGDHRATGVVFTRDRRGSGLRRGRVGYHLRSGPRHRCRSAGDTRPGEGSSPHPSWPTGCLVIGNDDGSVYADPGCAGPAPPGGVLGQRHGSGHAALDPRGDAGLPGDAGL